MKPSESDDTAAEGVLTPFDRSVALMSRLRAPGGCPWDREQTLATIRKYTVEEVYEVIDAIDRGHWDDLREELGDLLLQVLFYAEIASGKGKFTISDVLETLNRKLIRRHPHVFGAAASAAAGNQASLVPDMLSSAATEAGHVLRNWDAIKKAEKQLHPEAPPASLLDSVPRSFPALLEAAKLGSKAAKVGFDWSDPTGVVEKLHEELAELHTELHSDAEAGQSASRIEEELGDVLFTMANFARHLKIDAELALRSANAKFRRRFAAMEAASPGPLLGQSANELESLWNGVKKEERKQP